MSVLRFVATVKNGEVLVRDVDLPDGMEVDVSINELTPAELRALKLGEASLRRGETLSLEESLARLRAIPVPGAHEPRRARRPKASMRHR